MKVASDIGPSARVATEIVEVGQRHHFTSQDSQFHNEGAETNFTTGCEAEMWRCCEGLVGSDGHQSAWPHQVT